MTRSPSPEKQVDNRLTSGQETAQEANLKPPSGKIGLQASSGLALGGGAHPRMCRVGSRDTDFVRIATTPWLSSWATIRPLRKLRNASSANRTAFSSRIRRVAESVRRVLRALWPGALSSTTRRSSRSGWFLDFVRQRQATPQSRIEIQASRLSQLASRPCIPPLHPLPGSYSRIDCKE